ncbi:type II toxin-antitoxin system HicB family antitoxin [Olegusella massiliensis]|uniref:type II toxin-antitoxin system HicB family antitoxin n=1 Tax=Olegusella massiliensis TaxID=1776381 RepID=UPI0040557B97
MRYTYEVVIERDGDGWSAHIPQLEDSMTCADTREEVVRRAAELMELEIASTILDGKKLPKAEHVAEVVMLSVDMTQEDVDEVKYMTQKDAQEYLGLSASRVSALVNNGTLQSRIFGCRNMVLIESVNEYMDRPRKAGRPPKPSR